MSASKIYNADCMDPEIGLPSFSDNHFDLAIVDPPYGIDFQSSRRTENQRHKKIANDKEPFLPWIKALYPKMKDGGRLFIFYRWDVMSAFLNEAKAAGFTPVWDMVWDKVIHGMGDLKAAPGPRHEPFMYFTKGRYEFKGNRPTTVYRTPRVPAEQMIHPNEKPVRLYEALIRDFASPGEKMVDPFLGSAASFDAAQKMGLDFRGYELDTDYYNAAKNRMAKGIQMQLL
jgi:site-specific DNA-methyltransferase (adenine-specific)